MEKMIDLAVEVQEKIPGFTLAEGTSIMIKYNHRQSIDLDFFKEKTFSFNRLSSKVRKHFIVENEEHKEDNLDFFIDGIKESFVFFPFKPVKSVQVIKNVKMYSDYDLFLNKVYVAGRRIEVKDPFDAATLLSKHSWPVSRIKLDFENKFPGQSFEIYLGALLHFEDYDNLEDWVKKELIKLKEQGTE